MKRPALWTAAVAAVLSLNTLGNEFVLDDEPHVVTDPRAARVDVAEAFRTGYWYQEDHSGLYRPLTRLALSLERAAFGLRPAGFHAVQIGLHAACTALVTLLGTRLMGSGAGVIGGLLFAVHPVHAEAVSEAVGISDLLSTLGCLASLLFYVHWRRNGGVHRLVLSVLFFGCAIFSKESAAAFVLAPMALDPVLHGESLREGIRAWPRRLPAYLAILAPLILFLYARSTVLGYTAITPPIASAHEVNPDNRPFPLAHLSGSLRVLTSFRVLWRAALLCVFPLRMSSWYGYEEIREAMGAFEGEVLGGITLVIASAVLVARTARRPDGTFFALALAALAWLPVSHLLFPAGVLLGDRLLYLPSAPLALLGGAGCAALEKRFGLLANGILVVALVLLGARTLARNSDLRNNLSLWEASVQGAPRSSLAWSSYSQRLYQSGQVRAAEEAAHRALRINATSDQALNQLGLIATDEQRWDEGETWLRRAIEINPRSADAHFNVGRLCHKQARFQEAAGAMERAVELRPGSVLFREWSEINRGWMLLKSGDLDGAQRAFRGAAGIGRESGAACYYLGRLYIDLKRPEEARSWFEEAVRREPRNGMYREALGGFGEATGR